ncbi:MAG TPA: hypothetical protein VGL07_18235 [Buttiauxella sp.]|jgi:hypothetical protein
MNTHNINTAAPESSGRCDAVQRLTMPQLTDLFLYVMVNSEGQKQPGIFVPSQEGDLHIAVREGDGETVIVWTQNGWPLAAAIPESGYLAVLTGIAE